MTKEEILAMEAGRELDVLVAKEIFGIGVEWDHASWDVNELLQKLPFRKGQPRTISGPMAHPVSNTVYEYSTDILAAWRVVEKIRGMEDSRGNQLLCCLKIHSDYAEVWDIHWSYSESSIMNDGHKDHKLPLSWYSFPEAICKAALLVKYSSKNT